MKKTRYALLSFVACLAIAGSALIGCSNSGSVSSGTSKSAASSSASASTSASVSSSSASASAASTASASAQSASQAQVDPERQAEIERLKSLEQAYKKTVEEKDLWADGVVLDALNKLVDEGAIAPLSEDFKLFDKTFEFVPTDDGYEIDFLDSAVGARLTGDFSLDLSDGAKVAICRQGGKVDPNTGERLYDLEVVHTNKDGAFSTAVKQHDEKLLATPTLKPSGYFNMLDPAVPQDVFADTIDECRYLIAYGGCHSNILENYFSISPEAKGSIDRTDTTTVVLVIDAQQRTVLHIENIGTDIPKAGGDLTRGDHIGDTLTEEANAYISKLLLG